MDVVVVAIVVDPPSLAEPSHADTRPPPPAIVIVVVLGSGAPISYESARSIPIEKETITKTNAMFRIFYRVYKRECEARN